MGWENVLGLSPYNKKFRMYRKQMSKVIGSKPAAAQFDMLQEAEVGHFLLHLLDSPEKLINHIRKCVWPCLETLILDLLLNCNDLGKRVQLY